MFEFFMSFGTGLVSTIVPWLAFAGSLGLLFKILNRFLK